MLSSTASTILRLAGWNYIPDLATRQALGFIHRLPLFRHPNAPPPPGTPAWHKHYRYTFAAVVLGYLIYNLVTASSETPPNFYEILGVSPDADEGALKYAFRAFAKRNHPDRVGPQGEELFIQVRDAFEALKNPTTRFAYDRFGPDAITWSDCATPKEFIHKGLMQASGFYIGTSLVLLFFSAALSASPVAFWRYLLLASLFASELCLILDPPASRLSSAAHDLAGPRANSFFTTAVRFIFPRRVPHQHILLLHQIFVFLSVALSRVVPVLFPQPGKLTDAQFAPLVHRLHAIAQATDKELSRMIHIDLHAVHAESPSIPGSARYYDVPLPACSPSPEVRELLKREMEDLIVANQLREEGPLRSRWEAAVARGKAIWNASRKGSNSPNVKDTGEERGDRPLDAELDTLERNETWPPAPSQSVYPVEPWNTALPNGDHIKLPSPRPSRSPSPSFQREVRGEGLRMSPSLTS
ncbi:hypothetical protein BD410DRAFT_859597 [Rickenella mellea]|uniref:J domain-containing protein n=1 Tax=Rickenella mellea TaxID=50990 RepID=A0A4Y7Q611_9AGAM|nr:hypothetical protein BD410DRAFT_859597 [Rickenella mellea]